MAAPGSPKACVTPSRRRISTAARAAVIRGMTEGLSVFTGDDAGAETGSAAGQPLDAAQQRRVVEAAIADGPGRRHQLGEDGADRDDDARLAGCRGDDAEILVVQLDPEAGIEGPFQH